jgi:hypothetical protein
LSNVLESFNGANNIELHIGSIKWLVFGRVRPVRILPV